MTHRLQQELFDDESLIRRLHALGLGGVRHVESHENRSVMVSLTGRGVLRVHRGFAYAPDAVLAAILAFVKPGTRRPRRRAAQQMILAFPVDGYARSPRRRPQRPKPRPEDRSLLRRLAELHRQLNARFFAGELGRIRFRISRQMRRKLGELTVDRRDRPVEIAISMRHLRHDGWDEVQHTMLHEMVHQWQGERGLPVDHGATFRQKARSVGVVPRAVRDVGRTH
jgi:hypothetical protein